MLFLGLAFLTKGPVTLIFFLAAVIAWPLSKPATTVTSTQPWLHWIISSFIAILIVLPWYIYLFQLFPEELSATLQQEANDRNILNFSLSPLLNLVALALPWSLVLIGLIFNYFRRRYPKEAPTQTLVFLSLWLLLSLLPFFFFKTFGRYLYGCLLPLSILIPVLLTSELKLQHTKTWFRVSSILTATLGIVLFSLVVWFRDVSFLLILAGLSIALFITVWWQAKNMLALATTAILYWVSVIAVIYPAIGINRLPDTAIEDITNEYVILYAGPQPAMLSIASGRGLHATSRLWTLPEDAVQSCKGMLVYTSEIMMGMLNTQMRDLDLSAREIRHYFVLSSRGSWVKFTRKGINAHDWWQAIKNRDIDSLGNKIFLLRVTPNNCR